MALTRADCLIWGALADRGLIPPRPGLLEVGRANWYGDAPASWLVEQAQRRAPNLLPEVEAAARGRDVWALADLFYRVLLGVDGKNRVAVDLHGGPGADWLEHDLNEPLSLGRQFEVVINTGTLEHIFDQRQALQTIHEHCAMGGLMLHAGPLVGWLDHGMAHLQPGAYFDLATANAYDVLVFAYFDLRKGTVRVLKDLSALHALAKAEGLAEGSMSYFVFRKTVEAPFRVPMQGYYSERVSADLVRDWQEMR